MTNSIAEIPEADFIFAIGTNTTETHPVISLFVRRALRRGATLVVADPRRTELAGLATVHLAHRAGSDLALLNGLCHVIIKEGLWNREFVAQRTEGFEALREAVAKYPPEKVEAITGINAETIRRVAREYARAEKAMILYTMGVTQHICGTANVLAIANLALLTGHIGRPGTGVNPLRGQNNVQGACDMGGLPHVLTGYQSITDPAVREKFAAAWGRPLPATPGLTVGEMFEAALAGKVRAMYIVGENPVLSDPDGKHVAEALAGLDFLVVQDIFLSETAALADVVLPAACFAEKEGTFTNTERRVQLVRKAVDPPGEALPDWQIVCRLATAMGYPMTYPDAAAIMEEIARLTPSYGGISHRRLAQGAGLQWPCPTADHPGTPYLHAERFTRGLGKFHPVEYVPPAEEPDGNYPLLLTTGRRLFQYHTGTMSRRVAGLEALLPAEWLEVNPADLAALGLTDGEEARLSSRRGSLVVRVRASTAVPPGLVFTSFHFRELAINQLTNPARDPQAKIPELKVCAVRLEKL